MTQASAAPGSSTRALIPGVTARETIEPSDRPAVAGRFTSVLEKLRSLVTCAAASHRTPAEREGRAADDEAWCEGHSGTQVQCDSHGKGARAPSGANVRACPGGGPRCRACASDNSPAARRESQWSDMHASRLGDALCDNCRICLRWLTQPQPPRRTNVTETPTRNASLMGSARAGCIRLGVRIV